jgi:serine/threonine protein kinase
MNWISDTAVDRLRADIDLPDLSGTDYSLICKIAAGGMGTVYLAEDAKLARRVALKVMREIDASGELAGRMLREAQVLARLEHPSIVPIHDVGTSGDGRIFYVMKFVEGERLDQHARASSSLADLLRVFQKICEAVSFAHAHGVLHRDLKPENIMVGPFGEVLVMDWGVAKLTRETGEGDINGTTWQRNSDSVETVHGTVVGTRAYMAPEQARGESVDERADVYALGAILHSLLTGHPPTDIGQSQRESQARTRLMSKSAAVAGSRRLELISGQQAPRRLNAICSKALAQEPDGRYASAQELAADVARYLDGLPVRAYRENVVERAGRWLDKNRFVTILIVAYLVMRVILFVVTGR